MCTFVLYLKHIERGFEPLNPLPMYTGLNCGVHWKLRSFYAMRLNVRNRINSMLQLVHYMGYMFTVQYYKDFKQIVYKLWPNYELWLSTIFLYNNLINTFLNRLLRIKFLYTCTYCHKTVFNKNYCNFPGENRNTYTCKI